MNLEIMTHPLFSRRWALIHYAVFSYFDSLIFNNCYIWYIILYYYPQKICWYICTYIYIHWYIICFHSPIVMTPNQRQAPSSSSEAQIMVQQFLLLAVSYSLASDKLLSKLGWNYLNPWLLHLCCSLDNSAYSHLKKVAGY